MMKRTRRKKDDDRSMKFSGERLQDFLMPGLRHAHTLQQLKMVFEYSPPGEYLKQQIKDNNITKKEQQQQQKETTSNNNLS